MNDRLGFVENDSTMLSAPLFTYCNIVTRAERYGSMLVDMEFCWNKCEIEHDCGVHSLYDVLKE